VVHGEPGNDRTRDAHRSRSSRSRTANSSPGGIATGPDGTRGSPRRGSHHRADHPRGRSRSFRFRHPAGSASPPTGREHGMRPTGTRSGRSPSGVVKRVHTLWRGAHTITTGSDGNLWFTEWCCDRSRA
jgi:hypothetical protein